MNKIAVFGSAFNPPSLGHKSIIESISHYDSILLVPSIAHAWGKDMLDYDIRCELVDAFILDLNMPNVHRSDVEERLVKPEQVVTTFDVLDFLQQCHPESELTFILGPDNLFAFKKFHRASDILQRFSVLACPERVPVRSTTIRQYLAEKRSISELTTPQVVSLIAKRHLYTR
ncbi:nicotinate-nicotinamide nucleotide adenylyltransferase [Vibrio salinus]|uniref:nicotinate-nicotinamide nucleotide adenylyltransferase n=1 Tax=Vibrio salinus TaxID=2899784 RepID=UPI001E645E00|nr:nicotinate-nicotinamide nucleotide adenylyltransferase [Vibrio salinus]MCE0494910.1 nicotinate-nicotinamide nucleotide adenylyltransferase [Vibrio salinus]